MLVICTLHLGAGDILDLGGGVGRDNGLADDVIVGVCADIVGRWADVDIVIDTVMATNESSEVGIGAHVVFIGFRDIVAIEGNILVESVAAAIIEGVDVIVGVDIVSEVLLN